MALALPLSSCLITFTILLSYHLNLLSDAFYHQQHPPFFAAIQPPIYVIQHQPIDPNAQPAISWNNQHLTPLTRSLAASDENSKSSSSPRQIFYSDEPAIVPYYHSYKSMGPNNQQYTPLRGIHQQPAHFFEYTLDNQARAAQEWHPHSHSTKTKATKRARDSTAPAIVTKGGTKGGAQEQKGGNSSVGTKRVVGPRQRGGTKRREQEMGVLPPARGPTYGIDAWNNNNKTNPFGGGGSIERASRSGPKKLVCYYGTWAVYRPDAGKYPVENIDPFLCTHIIYGFTGLSYDNLIKPLDPWNDLEDNYGKGAMKRFTNLKRINPDLKTLVAIGGWNEGSIKYSKMASEPESRAKFVQSVVDFLAKYNFDGLDLDWEYPGARGGHSYDKANFVKLLRELKEAFAPRGYLLTAAVSAGKWFVDPAYDIAQVSKYLDLINLMAYDYHGGWETKTGMNAPLFHSNKHDLSKEEMTLNVNWSVNYWLQQGADREKLMLGVGSYGRSFTLDKASSNGINAPASQKGQAGPYTREPGSLGYNEICEAFQRQPNAWTIVREPDYLAPYAYNDRQWVGYDDVQSLALKAQYAKSMGLGGMMMWSIETDDFQGRCHNEKYPLLNTIKRVMNGAQLPGPEPVITTTSQPIPALKPSRTTTTTTAQPSARPTSGGSGSASTTTTSSSSSSTRRPPTQPPSPPVTPTRPSGLEVEEEARPSSSSSSTTVRPAQPARNTRLPNSSTTSKRPAVKPPQPPTKKPTTSVQPTNTSLKPATKPTKPRPTSSTTTSTTKAPMSSSTTSWPTTGGSGGGSEFVCRQDGMFADPANCRKFIRCVSLGSTGKFSLYKFDCGPGTAFNEQQQYCDFIYNVPNCNLNTNTNNNIYQLYSY